jgi:hypothetical protein
MNMINQHQLVYHILGKTKVTTAITFFYIIHKHSHMNMINQHQLDYHIHT